MKNKIFELYKPNSLAEFLEFHKNNPEEKFVYVLQHPPANINILGASDFWLSCNLFAQLWPRFTNNIFIKSICF